MIYHLSGELTELDGQSAVIDCGGVGYIARLTASAAGMLQGRIGEQVLIYTYMAVREDAMELYGFSSKEELSCFKMLISVNGVGAKFGISVLSILSPDEFKNAVAAGDAKMISRAQGVGAKLAQKIIIELKDKIGSIESVASSGPAAPLASGVLSETVEALVSLGYSEREAEAAVRMVNPNGLEVEEVLRRALALLAK